MKCLVLAFFLAIPLFASQQLLEVYADRAFLTQRFEVGSGTFGANLPEFVTLDALHVKSSCEVNEKRLGFAREVTTPHLEELNRARVALEDTKRALRVQEAKERLLERVSLSADSIENINDHTEKFGLMLEELLGQKGKLEAKVKEAQERYDALQTDPSAQKVKPLELLLACDGPSLLELRYPLNSLEIQRKNRFSGDMQEGRLKVEQNIFLTHRLGVDLDGVTLHLYGHAYNERLSPHPFYPWYINVQPLQPKRAMVAMAAPMNESMQITNDIEVANSKSKQFWEVSGLSLPSNETVQIPLDSQYIFADFDTFIDGYSQGFAYIRGKFTPQKPIDGGDGEFVLGGILVGGGWHEPFEAKEEGTLFFGKNDHIGVEKTLREDFTTINTANKTQTTQVVYEYTIHNRGGVGHEITLSERLPISKKGDVVVKALGDKPSETTALGEVRYVLEVAPGESKSIKFGHAITKPLPKE